MTSERASRVLALHGTEDSWATWLGFAIILVAMGAFCAESSIAPYAATTSTWAIWASWPRPRAGDIA